MKRTKQVNVDRVAWENLRKVLPRTSDSKRSIIACKVFTSSGFVEKLKPEFNDTKRDRMLKKILRDLI